MGVRKLAKTYKEKRPWGRFFKYTDNEVSTVKILEVKVAKGLSDQRHQKRFELWVFLTPGGKVTLEYANGEKKVIRPRIGQEVEIPPRTWHMLECSGRAPERLRVLEIFFGLFGENDNERRSDRYGRVK